MKKTISLSILTLTVFFATAHFTNAQTSTATSTNESGGIFSSVLENVNEIKEGVREQIVGDRAEKQTVLQKRAQERITNLAANISNRFDAIIARLQNIIDRLNSRLTKMENAGTDVSQARSSLTAAQNALNNARSQMTNIDQEVDSAIGSTDPRADWQRVRSKFITARDSIKVAHSELRNTLINLKAAPPAIINSEANSSTTPNN